MRIELYIARRLRSDDGNGRRAKASVRISTAGVVLSVVIMLITIAITSGFKHEIVNKLIGFDSQLSVQAMAADAVSAQPLIDDAPMVESVIGETLPGVSVEESMRLPAMLKTPDDFSAVVFRGYGGTSHDAFVANNIVEGALPVFAAGDRSGNSIVISASVARVLGLHVGDKINTCFFADDKMRLRNFEIAAIYDSGFGEYDRTVAYAPLSTLRKIAGLPDGTAARIEISGLETGRLAEAGLELQKAFSQAYYDGRLQQYIEVESILDTGAVYFNWLSLLDTNVVVILVLMTAISSFTLIASLIILILERVNMIGTLKMLGATNGLIRRVFILLDLKVFAKGLVVGNIVALVLIFVQQLTHVLPLDSASYYISFVPVRITLWQVLILNLSAMVVATAVMLLPSMIISRLKPATILRFE